ncbi:MAG: hypothetical protein JNK24_08050 [Alphaproteobacteria bacterium]|nr:hypothetical protein [Alphaproteobacteria bacterium]
MVEFKIGDKDTAIQVSGQQVILPAELVGKLITADGGDGNLTKLSNILNGKEVVSQTAESGSLFGKDVAVMVNGMAVILPQKLIDAMGGVEALTTLQDALDKAGVGDKPRLRVGDPGMYQPLPAHDKKVKLPEYEDCGPGHGTEPPDPVRRQQLMEALRSFNSMNIAGMQPPRAEIQPALPRNTAGPEMS